LRLTQLKLGDSPQIFFQYGSLDLKLVLVRGVLIVAAAAAREIRTRWLNPVGRRLEHLLQPGAREPGLLFYQSCFDPFSLEDKRNKDGFSAPMLIGGKTRQSVAAIHQLFDSEFQELILCHRAAMAIGVWWYVQLRFCRRRSWLIESALSGLAICF